MFNFKWMIVHVTQTLLGIAILCKYKHHSASLLEWLTNSEDRYPFWFKGNWQVG